MARRERGRIGSSYQEKSMNGHCERGKLFGELTGEEKPLAVSEEALRRLVHVERHPNGGASVVHVYQDELDRLLSGEQTKTLADIFFRFDHTPAPPPAVRCVLCREVFRESEVGCAVHVMGVVHGAAGYLPEMVQYLSTMHPDLLVKAGWGNLHLWSPDSHMALAAGHLRKSEVQSVRMEEYAENVAASYCQGTFRAGPLQQVSLVGQVAEESGGFLPDVLG